MIGEILRQTPSWVFGLFSVLLALGIMQSRPRRVSRSGILALPAAMAILSIYGTASAFGTAPEAWLGWLVGLLGALWMGTVLRMSKDVITTTDGLGRIVPGSWIPLVLMMAIFSTKYMVGMAFARQLTMVGLVPFVVGICVLYGAFTGLIAARALAIWNTRTV